MKSTIILSVLGLSLASNAAFLIEQLRGVEKPAALPAAHQVEDDYCLLDSLKLDPEQLRRLGEMRRKMHKKRTAHWQRANAIKVELAEAICAAQADSAALDAELKRYAESQAAMQRAVAEHLLGVNAMLRPGQRDGFRAVLRTEMFRGIRSSRHNPAGAP